MFDLYGLDADVFESFPGGFNILHIHHLFISASSSLSGH
jgi:hypothetical protein